LILKPELSSTPTDFDGLSGSRALKISEPEIGAKDKNSEDDEREGKASRQGL
jgi:hypothetical protein